MIFHWFTFQALFESNFCSEVNVHLFCNGLHFMSFSNLNFVWKGIGSDFALVYISCLNHNFVLT